MTTAALVPAVPDRPQPPRLLDQVRQAALARFGRPEPGERYREWIRRFILFHGKRHPRELATGEVARFLEHLAQSEKDPLRSLEQAREALVFLYHDVLHVHLGELVLPEPPRLLDRMRRALRVGHYSPRTEACYVEWAERFIRFHGLRHPNTMGKAEIEMFLTDLAVNGHVAASTQNAFGPLSICWEKPACCEGELTGRCLGTRLARAMHLMRPGSVAGLSGTGTTGAKGLVLRRR